MSVHDLERYIVGAAREKLENRRLRLKDLMEWRTTPINDARDDEVVIELNEPLTGHVFAAFKKSCDLRGKGASRRGLAARPKPESAT